MLDACRVLRAFRVFGVFRVFKIFRMVFRVFKTQRGGARSKAASKSSFKFRYSNFHLVLEIAMLTQEDFIHVGTVDGDNINN